MKKLFSSKILAVAKQLPSPLYVVGGACRDYLITKSLSNDIDLCCDCDVTLLLPLLLEQGFTVFDVNGDFGYIKWTDGEKTYEYTRFRCEEYDNDGKHTPKSITFTDDILVDAKRRDFKCNAVYYDLKNGKFVDVLGGIKDISNRVLSTVIQPEKVLCNDGERLFRLARFSGELGFSIEEQTMMIAKKYSHNALDLSSEKIFEQLNKILLADQKPTAPENGHYLALKALDNIGVLQKILPEVTLGRGLEQRSDFHNHDVLEHTFRAVLYSPKNIRLSALLHDVGKPYCMINYSNYYNHDKEGERIAKTILDRFKVRQDEKKKILFLTAQHMLDISGDMKERKVRRFIALNFDKIPDLLALKTADFMASKDSKEQSKVVEKWQKIIEKMKEEGVAFSLSQLKITAKDLIELGYKEKEIGQTLKRLYLMCAEGEVKNNRESLIRIAKKRVK